MSTIQLNSVNFLLLLLTLKVFILCLVPVRQLLIKCMDFSASVVSVKDTKIMLLLNLWVEIALVNSPVGTVHKLVLPRNNSSGLSVSVICIFPLYKSVIFSKMLTILYLLWQ